MRPSRSTPAQLTPGWPKRVSPDPDAEAVRLLAVRLREVVGRRPLRALSEVTGVNHAAIGKVLAGASWPDTRTLARLERGLEASLWPVVGAAGTHVAATSDVVIGEGAEQIRDGDGSAAGRGTA